MVEPVETTRGEWSRPSRPAWRVVEPVETTPRVEPVETTPRVVEPVETTVLDGDLDRLEHPVAARSPETCGEKVDPA